MGRTPQDITHDFSPRHLKKLHPIQKRTLQRGRTLLQRGKRTLQLKEGNKQSQIKGKPLEAMGFLHQ